MAGLRTITAGAARRAGWLLHLSNAAALAMVAFGLVWSTGFRGFMPLDQSIVWDGAWRLLGGERPIADFLAPNGLVPAAIQAGMFSTLGLSWSTYVMHAALANSALAVVAYVWLASLFKRSRPAALYALAAAAAFYPPVGTPFMDQHAVLFSTLLIVLAAHAGTREPAPSWPWLLVAPVALLALLSKQTPSVWAIIWAGGMLALLAARGRATRASLASLVVGAIATGAAATAAFLWSGATPGDLGLALIGLPGDAGAERLSWSWLAPRLGDLAKPGLLAVAIALAVSAPGLSGRPDWPLHAAASGLVATAALHLLTTDNSAWFCLGALPIAAGLAHVLLERRFAGGSGVVRRVGWIVAIVTALQALITFVDTSLPRAANELRRADWARAGRGDDVDRRLGGLVWALPPAAARDAGAETGAAPYRRLLDHLRTRPGGFVLIGDATVLYSLAGKPSAFPALWFHSGLTYPRSGDPARAAFDERLAQALVRHDVRTIVIDGMRTWTGARAEDFRPIAACLARARDPRDIGRFRVVSVPPGCAAG